MKRIVIFMAAIGPALLLAGCLEKEKPEVVIKRVYVKTPRVKPPAECSVKEKDIPPVPKGADINTLTSDAIGMRKMLIEERAVKQVCLQAVKK